MFLLKMKFGEGYELKGEYRLLRDCIKAGVAMQNEATPRPMFHFFDDEVKIGELKESGTMFLKASHLENIL